MNEFHLATLKAKKTPSQVLNKIPIYRDPPGHTQTAQLNSVSLFYAQGRISRVHRAKKEVYIGQFA